MKKTIFLIAVFCTACVWVTAQQAVQQAADPLSKQLSFKNAEYAMGKISLGKPVEYTVEIKNIGNDTMVLESAVAGCGCTTPDFKPNEKFGPGQTVKVIIRFNGSVAGPFTRNTTIGFSGGLYKQVSFTGEGVAEPAKQANGTAAKAKLDKHD